MNGRRTETNCDTPYDGTWQEWLLLKPINILPLGLTLEYLANESRHNPVARREMILTLYRAGICCDIIAKILKLLYGSTMPLVDDVSTAPTKKGRQEQLLCLVKSGESPEEACSLMKLLYGMENPFAETAAVAHAEFSTAIQDVSKTDDGAEYVKVDSHGPGLNKISLNTPVVMVSSIGSTLNAPERCSWSYSVVLSEKEDGFVVIRDADDSARCLVLNPYQHCVFGKAELALKFQTRVSSNGQLVLVEHATGCALETESQGDTKLVVCRNKYSRESQSWVLCTTYELDSCKTKVATSPLSSTVTSDAAAERRHFIMQLVECRQIMHAEDIGSILKDMYGTSEPLEPVTATDANCIERQQQNLKLLDARIPIDEIGKFLTIMYGTSAPLSK